VCASAQRPLGAYSLCVGGRQAIALEKPVLLKQFERAKRTVQPAANFLRWVKFTVCCWASAGLGDLFAPPATFATHAVTGKQCSKTTANERNRVLCWLLIVWCAIKQQIPDTVCPGVHRVFKFGTGRPSGFGEKPPSLWVLRSLPNQPITSIHVFGISFPIGRQVQNASNSSLWAKSETNSCCHKRRLMGRFFVPGVREKTPLPGSRAESARHRSITSLHQML